MTVCEVASSLSSKINMWYLDDDTLGGPVMSVFADVGKCVTELKQIGLEVIPSKCEVINMSLPVDEFTELRHIYPASKGHNLPIHSHSVKRFSSRQ